jgi:WXG100 family type VII secretion target
VTVRYTADLEAIHAHVQRAQAFVDHLEQTLAHLDKVVDGLHLTWTGQAADAHRLAHREWTDGARELREGLSGMVAAAELAHGNYSGAATANLEMWGPLR